MRWGQGSLQEIDHVPFVAPLTKLGRAPPSRPPRSPAWSTRRSHAALEPPTGPDLRRLPARPRLHGGRRRTPTRRSTRPTRWPPRPPTASTPARRAAARRRAPGDHGRHRPLLGATASTRSASCARSCAIPVFLNGLARGCVPADHRCFFSRARGTALKGADVALVIGVPMDFRLGFGGSFGEETQI